MLTVSAYKQCQSKDGRAFIALELNGGLEMVQSQLTGRFYGTIRRCSISTTFSEDIAKGLVGTQVPGSIQRVACEPYDYTVPSTGEVIKLAHRWEYVLESSLPTSATVIQSAPLMVA